jgi:hypothetical protein
MRVLLAAGYAAVFLAYLGVYQIMSEIVPTTRVGLPRRKHFVRSWRNTFFQSTAHRIRVFFGCEFCSEVFLLAQAILSIVTLFRLRAADPQTPL